jgi:hypothetical protein
MITTGKIISISQSVFMVRLPVFESAGLNKQCILPCVLCYTPGNLNAYNIGDGVFVSFINNSLSQPVIIGKIYEGLEKEASNFSYASSLEVTKTAVLPLNTILGDTQLTSILNYGKDIKLLEDRVKALESK